MPAATTPTTATPALKTPPPTTTTTAPPPQGEPDITEEVLALREPVADLEQVVRRWDLACQTKSEVELDLAYVRDALNQGNILGARALLGAWISESASYGNEGLMSAAEVSTFDTDATEILDAIPTEGHFDNEFHPSTYVPPPVPVACTKLPVAPPDSTISTAAVATSLPIEDLNNASRIIFKTALGKVPGVGFVLGALIELLWPTSAGNNVTWQQMSEYVDQKIGQAVDQITKDDLDNKLTGLSGVLHNYEIALQDPSNPTFIRENFVSALNHLTAAAPSFSPQTRPYLVLPEYVQIYNFLLNQLRDGIIFGPSWGIPQVSINDYKAQLASKIVSAGNYVTAQSQASHDNMTKPPNSSARDKDHYNVNLFSYNANLDLALVPAGTDQSFYWPYMDPVQYPNPVNPVNTRILFSPGYGFMPNGGTPSVNRTPRPQMVRLTVWGYDRLDAMQVTYGLGNPADPKVGGSGGTNVPPRGGDFPLGPAANTRGVVTRVEGYAGDVQEELRLIFTNNGSQTNSGLMANNRNLNRTNYSVSLPDNVLGYVQIMGVFPSPYNSAATTIFGFRLADSYS